MRCVWAKQTTNVAARTTSKAIGWYCGAMWLAALRSTLFEVLWSYAKHRHACEYKPVVALASQIVPGLSEGATQEVRRLPARCAICDQRSRHTAALLRPRPAYIAGRHVGACLRQLVAFKYDQIRPLILVTRLWWVFEGCQNLTEQKCSARILVEPEQNTRVLVITG